jgi:hypothetical protein
VSHLRTIEEDLKKSKYSVSQMGDRYPTVMPAKAGVQAFLLDSRQKHAGMTSGISVTSLYGAVLRSTSIKITCCDHGHLLQGAYQCEGMKRIDHLYGWILFSFYGNDRSALLVLLGRDR